MENPEETQIDEDKKFEIYKLLIAARNFHYDNFNKWNTYFYIASGALFVAYYTLISNLSKDDLTVYSILFLGLIVSLFWYWSCKGYYYWNINFITLINNFESEKLKLDLSERVYSVFANKETQNNYLSPISGANISTSKIAIFFAFVISVFWSSFLIFNFFSHTVLLGINCFYLAMISVSVSVFIVLLLSFFVPRIFFKSSLDPITDLKLPLKNTST